jgi:hypothetical protein
VIAALKLSTVGDIATLVAAGAALVTVFFAAKTVGQAKEARKEERQAHKEEMEQHASLLQATTTAHEHEMTARKLAFDAELVLQRLAQLGRVMELAGEAADMARADIANPPPPTGIGNGTWTRVTGALARLEAAAVIYERLGGPQLPPEIKTFSIECRRMGTSPKLIVGEAMSVLEKLKHLAETDESLAPPTLS